MNCEKYIPKFVKVMLGRNDTGLNPKPDDVLNMSSEYLELQKKAKLLFFTGDESALERQVIEHSVYHNQ